MDKERDKFKKKMLKQGWKVDRETDGGVLFTKEAPTPTFEETVKHWKKKCRTTFWNGIGLGAATGMIISKIIQLIFG